MPVRVVTAIALVILGWRLARDIGRTLAPRAVPPDGPRDRGHGRLPHPPHFLIAAVLVALQHRGPRAADARRLRRDRRGRLRSRRPADARQPDRGRRADLGPAVQGRRPRPAAVRRPRRRARGHRRLARPALHDLRPRRGLDHGPEQHRPRGRGRAAARAVRRRPPRPAAPRRDAERGPGAAREGIRTPVRAEPHIGLEEIDKRRGRRPHRRHAAADADGPQLADEILAAIAPITREGQTEERLAARMDEDDAHPGRPAPAAADPSGHVTQEYES